MGMGGIDSGRDLGVGSGRPDPEGVTGDGSGTSGLALEGEEARVICTWFCPWLYEL